MLSHFKQSSQLTKLKYEAINVPTATTIMTSSAVTQFNQQSHHQCQGHSKFVDFEGQGRLWIDSRHRHLPRCHLVQNPAHLPANK